MILATLFSCRIHGNDSLEVSGRNLKWHEPGIAERVSLLPNHTSRAASFSKSQLPTLQILLPYRCISSQSTRSEILRRQASLASVVGNPQHPLIQNLSATSGSYRQLGLNIEGPASCLRSTTATCSWNTLAAYD